VRNGVSRLRVCKIYRFKTTTMHVKEQYVSTTWQQRSRNQFSLLLVLIYFTQQKIKFLACPCKCWSFGPYPKNLGLLWDDSSSALLFAFASTSSLLATANHLLHLPTISLRVFSFLFYLLSILQEISNPPFLTISSPFNIILQICLGGGGSFSRSYLRSGSPCPSLGFTTGRV
jgi:hypothetical protein